MEGKRVKTLLIEDNPADVELLKIAFQQKGIETDFVLKKDGSSAIEYLKQINSQINGNSPQIIILDINLPVISGMDVLKVIKLDETLRKLPVIVMSNSKSKEDIDKSYQLYANSYLEKTADFKEFLETVEALKSFWYERTKLP